MARAWRQVRLSAHYNPHTRAGPQVAPRTGSRQAGCCSCTLASCTIARGARSQVPAGLPAYQPASTGVRSIACRFRAQQCDYKQSRPGRCSAESSHLRLHAMIDLGAAAASSANSSYCGRCSPSIITIKGSALGKQALDGRSSLAPQSVRKI